MLYHWTDWHSKASYLSIMIVGGYFVELEQKLTSWPALIVLHHQDNSGPTWVLQNAKLGCVIINDGRVATNTLEIAD